MGDQLLKLMAAAAPWSASCLAAQMRMPLDSVLRELERQVAAGRVKQHGWNPQGMAMFWLPEQLEEQLWSEAEYG